MDMSGKDSNVELPKRCSDTVDYQEPNMSSGWQVNGNNLTNASIGMIPIGNSMGEPSARPCAPLVDSFGLPIWDQNGNGQSLGYCDVNVANGASTSGSVGAARTDIGWTSNAMFRGGMFVPSVPRMLPPSLPHLPADSAFIERAARFSCFSGGNFGEMMNSFSVPDPLAPLSRGLGMMPGPHEVFGGNESKTLPEVVSKDALLPGKQVGEGGSYDNAKKSEGLMCTYDGMKCRAGVSRNESDEAEFSGRSAQEEPRSPAGESLDKGLGNKKRKRREKDTENDENNDTPQPSADTTKTAVDIKQKGDQNPSSISKPGGKHGKQGSQSSDPPKEEYIHVRARRGQATNSHSLAERVRREKISERMKFLQDLVPGCSKVTGKAVMLDEIINYVQSLQRQVEFLSMKLATVNPRLDFNIEAFLAKDPRAGLSPSLPFPLEMTMPFPPLHPSQPGLIQSGLLGNSSEALRRPINLQSNPVTGGCKEPTSQVPSAWEDELHNVVHMGFNTSAPLNSQDLSGSLPSGHMKAES